MKKSIKMLMKISVILVVALSFQACSLKVPLKSTVESDNAYEPVGETKAVQEVNFKNALDADSKIITGRFKDVIFLELNGKKLDGYSFIKEALIKEFRARKLPIKVSQGANNELVLKNFDLFTHRSSSFHPLVTISMLKVTASLNGEEKSFVSVVKRGKVPIWAMDEVFDPCYNEPITLLVKEIVAKINKAYFGYQLSDKKVFELIAKVEDGISKKDKLNYLNIYELGFSNNIKALETLKKHSNSQDEYLRLSSLAMLGFLGGEQEFDYLVAKYRSGYLWQDRAMALKSIADMNTPKTKEFINTEYTIWKPQDTKEGKWNSMILELYR